MILWKCTKCGVRWRLEREDFPIRHCGVRHEYPLGVVGETTGTSKGGKRRKQPPAHNEGVGTELKALVELLNRKPKSGCGCKAFAMELNRRGIEWCKANREKIVAKLDEAYHGLTWNEVRESATAAVKSGLVFRLYPWDVRGSLVDLAIERAGQRP